MKLIKNGKRYETLHRFDEKDIIKAAGFRWHGQDRVWYTFDKSAASRLLSVADVDPEVRAELSGAAPVTAEAAIEAILLSTATDHAGEFPIPDRRGPNGQPLAYKGFQKAAIAFGATRRNILIGDDMGLGKTIQAIGIVNNDGPAAFPVLIICPASLKRNWARELRLWLCDDHTIAEATGDSLPNADVVIVNYDIAYKLEGLIHDRQWGTLIADEAHYMKNRNAQRSKVVLGARGARTGDYRGFQARRRLYMTGSPLPSRPAELFPLIHSLDPESWPSWKAYEGRYCLTDEHLPELQAKLRATVMIRRLKRDVLSELPPKVRQVIEFPAGAAAATVAAELAEYERSRAALDALLADVEAARQSGNEEAFKAAVRALRAAEKVRFTELSKRRHETALEKVGTVIDFLKEVSDSVGKVVAFGYHQDMIKKVSEAFPGRCVVITGETPVPARQGLVDRFQTDPSIDFLFGQITAAGVGLTMTASSTVVMMEEDWVPGNVSQAEDRCHRYGQRSSVMCYHLVLEGSLDAKMAQTIIEKQNVIDAALNNQGVAEDGSPSPEIEAMLDSVRERAERDATARALVEERAAVYVPAPARVRTGPTGSAVNRQGQSFTIEPRQLEAIEANLSYMVSLDLDRARVRNNMGFNKLDGTFMHDFHRRGITTPKQADAARKVLRKYKRQIGADAVEKMFA